MINVDSHNLIDSNDIVEKADKALYAAKQRDRNCVVRWDQIDPDKKTKKHDVVNYEELQIKLSSVATKLHSQAIGTVTAFTKVMAIKDPYVSNHVRNVELYASAIAEQLKLSSELKGRLSTACLLHDLGRIAIPDSIMNKKGSLSDKEFEIIRQHPVVSAQILEPIAIFSREVEIIRQHHEHFNGTGYPDGLKGKEIAIGARILAVANFFDSITSERSYRPVVSGEEALAELTRASGTRFDPEIVATFTKAYKKNKEQWPLSVKGCLVESS